MSDRLVWLVILASFIGSCSSLAEQPIVPVAKCEVGKVCAIEGLLRGTRTGSIRDQTGCVAVALPPGIPPGWYAKRVRASGKIYEAPDTPGLVLWDLRGRDVDAEACYSGRAMYVDRIKRVR